MKANFGSIVVAGRGAIGTKVASRNAYGDFFRARVTPVDNPNTFKTTARTYFKEASQAWRTLSQVQRDAWNRSVGNFLFTDIFANVRKPSGFNLFMSISMNRRMSGRAILTAPPLPRNVPPVLITSVFADFSSNVINVTFSKNLNAGQALLVYATPAYSAGISSYYGRWGFVHVLDAYGGLTRSYFTLYSARFGGMPPAGSKIQFKIVTIDTATGLISLPQSAGTIVQL